jgi:CDP-ribitol ribitolphosphotransferase
MSENRFSISENLEAIDKRLRERNLDKDFKISYSFRNIFDKKYSIFSQIKLVIKIASSDYIFIDDYTPILSLFNLRKGTSLVQTWHAGVGFKTVGYARFGIAGSPHPYHSCHRKYTYGLVGCESLKEIYSEVWGIPKSSLIASGMPRLDHFLDDDVIKSESERLYNKYPQIKGKKVLLFAPTYRGTTQKDAYYDFDKLDLPKLYEFCKENNTVVIFKMHHFIKEPVPIEDYMRDLFIEINDEKINNLYYISDVLITDYSSCFYDYSLLKKPILFYLYDEDLYIATRGVQRPIEDVAPGKICHSFDEMLDAIKNEDFETEKLDKFYIDQNINKEKTASDIVIDTVILKKRG